MAIPDSAAIHTSLTRLAIIGPALDRQTYLAGTGFSREIVFAGCSPHLVMTPPEDGSAQFCHVAIHGPFAEPQLVTGPNTVKPRCPQCRQRIADWRKLLSAAGATDAPLGCSGCQAPLQACELDWREHAICGRVLIELRNVFPGEATPSDRLLEVLQNDTSMPWRFAWAAYLSASPGVTQLTTT
jgi:hypothetical protein